MNSNLKINRSEIKNINDDVLDVIDEALKNAIAVDFFDTVLPQTSDFITGINLAISFSLDGSNTNSYLGIDLYISAKKENLQKLVTFFNTQIPTSSTLVFPILCDFTKTPLELHYNFFDNEYSSTNNIDAYKRVKYFKLSLNVSKEYLANKN